MKIVFMGTPEFGATVLDSLIKNHEIVLVVTQPDKLVGRKQIIEFSPVKKLAMANNIEVFQPINIRKEYQKILEYDFDLIVTAAFGQILGKKLLEYSKYRAINVHASLLPKYRGGAPIQRAIMNGEEFTGISIIYMESKMDAGDIIMQTKIPIEKTDNADSLFDKLAILGGNLIIKAIDEIKSGKKGHPQNEEDVTYAYNIDKGDEKIDFSKPAIQVFNQIRGLATNPGGYFIIKDKVFKVYSSQVDNSYYENQIGEIVDVGKDFFTVACGKNGISFTSVKPEGRNLMSVRDYLNGQGKLVIEKGEIIQ